MKSLEKYRFGRVDVFGETCSRDLVVFGGEVLCPWLRKEGHSLEIADLSWALDRNPKAIIIGTGATGRMKVPDQTLDDLQDRGVVVMSYKTGKAVDVYNKLADEEKVAICLHLTC